MNNKRAEVVRGFVRFLAAVLTFAVMLIFFCFVFGTGIMPLWGNFAVDSLQGLVQAASKNSFPQPEQAYLSITPSSVQVVSFPASFIVTFSCRQSVALNVFMTTVNSV